MAVKTKPAETGNAQRAFVVYRKQSTKARSLLSGSADEEKP